jgi:hypothetical protein
MVPILAGIKHEKAFDLILEAWMKGCHFQATDEAGKAFEGDREFRNRYGFNFKIILEEHCGLKPGEAMQIFEVLDQLEMII